MVLLRDIGERMVKRKRRERGEESIDKFGRGPVDLAVP